MTQYACVRCRRPMDNPPECDHCQDHTLAIEVLEPEPGRRPGPRMTRGQEIAIRSHFKGRGEVNTRKRMLHLSNLIGRPIHAYGDITEAEAAKALRRMADGR